MKLRKLFAPLLALAMLASCAGPKMTWDDCIKDGEKLAAKLWTSQTKLRGVQNALRVCKKL